MGDVDIQAIKSVVSERRLHIRKLRNLAEEIELLHVKYNSDKIKGNGASLVGGGLGVVSGVMTIVTGGLFLPAIGIIGTAVGVAGGIWNFTGATKKTNKEKEILQEIRDLLKEDKDNQETIRSECSKFEMLDNTQRTIVGEQILTIMRGWGGVALAAGPQAAMKALAACLIPMGQLFTGIPVVMAFLGVAAQGTKELFGSAAKEMADEGVRTAVENATKHLPNNWTKKYIIENAYGEIVKRGGKNMVKLSEEGVKAMADDAAKAVASEALKLSRMVGGITAGLGALSCFWDAYQISEAWDGSKKDTKTKFGIAVRRIANELEKPMNRGGG